MDDPTSNSPDHPNHIGPYKLLELLGEGGMGEVWLAEQSEPVHRRVALKVIKLGMDTKQVLARLEAERQALAVMDHPNIASFFDGGATDTGRPYFVMELVQGVSITEDCDTHRLNTDERLRLFTDVCHAVQHAHQKGVIHRDLKPSNILVAVKENEAVVKIIDFGIAKALGRELTDRTLVTRVGQMIGTPEYMSPEQAEMTELDVDTRTDIYSLGVMLFELLVGTLPFDFAAKAELGPEEGAEIRSRLDHPQGDGEGPDPPVRDGQRPGLGSGATSSERARSRPRAEHSLQGREIHPAASDWGGGGSRSGRSPGIGSNLGDGRDGPGPAGGAAGRSRGRSSPTGLRLPGGALRGEHSIGSPGRHYHGQGDSEPRSRTHRD